MSGKNPFYTEEDGIDDDEFLRRSKGGGGAVNYMLPNHGAAAAQAHGGHGHPHAAAAVDPIDARRQMLMEKRREIEERTLDSSQRSLGLLHESERVGVATAEELSRQKDQLRGTEQRLDDINSTLKQSERHLQGIKGIFGGLRNYFSGKGPAAAAAANAAGSAKTRNVLVPSDSLNPPSISRFQLPREERLWERWLRVPAVVSALADLTRTAVGWAFHPRNLHTQVSR